MKEEGDDEEDYKWWAEQGGFGDGTERWMTLEHNGVFFPPEYVPVPKEIKMKYDGGENLNQVTFILTFIPRKSR